MAWMKTNQELRRHPKVKHLARMLGISLPDAIGRLHLLWWWAMDYAQDGDLSRYEAEDIADAMMWDEDPRQLVDALIQCGGKGHGFLDMTEDGSLFLHDWNENCGDEYRKRASEAQRLREYRAKKRDERTSTESPQSESVHVQHDERTSTYAYANENVHVRGEEKRGEEKKGDNTPPTPPSQGGGAEGEAYPPDFESFWAAYPRRVEKKAAFKAWLGVVRHGADPAEVVQAAAEYRDSAARQGTPQDKIKHPATFLHEDRWKDWLPPGGAAYLEAVKPRSLTRGRDSPQEAIPRSYEEAVAKYRRGGAIDIEAVEVARNDEKTGLRAVC